MKSPACGRFSAGGGFGDPALKNIADAKRAHPCGDDDGKDEPGDSVMIRNLTTFLLSVTFVRIK
jgi:hypothetical protein